jgi:histone H3/H4
MTKFIVKSNVREALDEHPVSADLYEALDEEVEKLLEEAAERAEANDRKTVMPYDL